MKNIHLIQTETYPAKLQLDRDYGTLTVWDEPCVINGQDFVGANLYITSDKLNTVGWYLDNNNHITKTITDQKSYWEHRQNYQKIILTTDTRLIADNIQAIDDEFLDWFCENPNCEYVEIVQEQTNNKPNTHYATLTLYKYKIIIPKGEPKNNFIKSKTEFLGITYTLKDGSKQFVPNLKEELKTSEEWQKQFNENVVLNPDGWDRKNYDYSWYEEKITFTEYNRRRSQSTCKNSIPKKELNRETLEEAAHKMLVDYGIKSMGQSIGVLTVKKLMVDMAKWQQEQDKNKFSEEDVKEAFYMGEKHVATEKKVYPQSPDFETWFKQFKNK